MNFTDKLEQSIKEKDSLLCVGIDPDISKIEGGASKMVDFCKRFIDETVSYAAMFKPQFAYFAAYKWWEQHLLEIMEYLRKIWAITGLDVKRGDIDRTSAQYAEEVFWKFGADAVTLNPYMGQDVVIPFIERYPDKWLFLLGRTSNEHARDIQDLELKDGRKVYEEVVRMMSHEWNTNGQIGIVAGATFPEELANIRSIVGDRVNLLVPGIGTQGWSIANVVPAAQNSQWAWCVISSSSAVMFPKKPGETPAIVARATRDEINKYRRKAA